MRNKHTLILAGLLAVLAASPAMADIFGFTQIVPGTVPDVGPQLTVEVTDGGTEALFKFVNNVGIASTVRMIQIDLTDGFSLLDIASGAIAAITSGPNSTVQFNALDFTPGNFAEGNNLNPVFEGDVEAIAANPTPHNGLNEAGDSITLSFDYVAGKGFSDVLAALNSGDLRIGLFVQSIGTAGGSDHFINTTNGQIPAPAAAMLAMMGLGLTGWMRRRLS